MGISDSSPATTATYGSILMRSFCDRAGFSNLSANWQMDFQDTTLKQCVGLWWGVHFWRNRLLLRLIPNSISRNDSCLTRGRHYMR
jgi:hypothetical protein